MTAEQLRNSILQEAISGRLVPHDPNDEPASVILEQTMQERAELLASKEIRKDDLKVSPIEDELPFELPSGWEWVTVDRIAIVKGGKRIPVGKTFSDTPTPYMYIRVTEMKNNTLIDCEHKYISAELRELLKRYIIHSTDIYVTIAGTIGAVGDVPEKFDGMNLTENALKLSHLHVDKKYLIYALSSTFVQEQFKEKTNKVGQPKLAMERVKSTLLPLPPLAEQQRIVAKLEELLPIVEQYGKAQTELDELNAALPSRLRQSILQQAIQGKLVPQDQNDDSVVSLFTSIHDEMESLIKAKVLKKTKYAAEGEQENDAFPESWVSARLADLCQLTDGEKKSGKFVCLDAKYLRGKSKGDYLTSGKYVVKGEKIILVDGENSGEVFVTPCDGYMGSTFKQLWVSSKMYLPYVLYFIAFHKNHLRNSKKGAAIPHLNKDIFYNLSIGIPPLSEQQRIVAKIEELFAEIDKISK